MFKNLEKSAEEQEDKAEALQKTIDHVKAKVPCVRILAYHWDLIETWWYGNIRDQTHLNDLKIHFQKMDTVKIKLKFIFVSPTVKENAMKKERELLVNKDHFANLDVEFLTINDEPSV